MGKLGIIVDKSKDEPVYKQVYSQICEMIFQGALKPGEILPKIRDLASQLGIARNTVEAAYKQLAFEGLAHGKKGTGYIVQEIDLATLHEGFDKTVDDSDFSFLAGYDSPLGDTYGCTFDFSYGNRRSEDIPTDMIRACLKEMFKDGLPQESASYINPMGLPGLREQIAKHLAATRGVKCRPEQIILQPGTQPALETIVTLFDPNERRVAAEEPGYDSAVDLFKRCGCDILPIPVHRGDDIALKALNRSGARCYFCTPSNQFPLGFIAPIATRLKIIAWARENGSYIIEDDYCCEYRYDGLNQVPSLQTLDPDHVIYLGTMSKIFSPAVRISYIVMPPKLLRRWAEKNKTTFCSLPWIDQRMLELFMEKGYWDKQTRSTVAAYKRRHDLLVSSIRKYMGDNVIILGENAGLHVLLGDKLHRRQTELIELARRVDVRVYETNCYMSSKGSALEHYVLVGFSSIDPELIEEGIRRLAQAWYG